MQHRQHSRVYLGNGLKRCAKCAEPKPLAEFFDDKRRPGTKTAYCRLCHQGRVRDYRREHRSTFAHRERTQYAAKRWASHLRRKYGITPEQYYAMLAAQDGKCAICRSTEPGGKDGCKRFHVDHIHGTQDVRGLLCSKCNQLLGYGDDNPAILEAAAAYLKKPIIPQVAAEFIKAFQGVSHAR